MSQTSVGGCFRITFFLFLFVLVPQVPKISQAAPKTLSVDIAEESKELSHLGVPYQLRLVSVFPYPGFYRIQIDPSYLKKLTQSTVVISTSNDLSVNIARDQTNVSSELQALKSNARDSISFAILKLTSAKEGLERVFRDLRQEVQFLYTPELPPGYFQIAYATRIKHVLESRAEFLDVVSTCRNTPFLRLPPFEKIHFVQVKLQDAYSLSKLYGSNLETMTEIASSPYPYSRYLQIHARRVSSLERLNEIEEKVGIEQDLEPSSIADIAGKREGLRRLEKLRDEHWGEQDSEFFHFQVGSNESSPRDGDGESFFIGVPSVFPVEKAPLSLPLMSGSVETD